LLIRIPQRRHLGSTVKPVSNGNSAQRKPVSNGNSTQRKPVSNGNSTQRNPVFWEKFYSPEDPTSSSCLKRNLPAATRKKFSLSCGFVVGRFRCISAGMMLSCHHIRLEMWTGFKHTGWDPKVGFGFLKIGECF